MNEQLIASMNESILKKLDEMQVQIKINNLLQMANLAPDMEKTTYIAQAKSLMDSALVRNEELMQSQSYFQQSDPNAFTELNPNAIR